MTIRVVVADDQLLVRTGLTMILNAQPGIEVVGEAIDGHEAVAVARELRPDVCLFDIRMPGIDGVEATRQLAGPGVEDPLAIVVITTFDLDEYVYGALKAGARGFLLKDAGPELLVQAIEAAANGDALISPTITRRLLTTLAGLERATPPAQPIEPITATRGRGPAHRRPRAYQRRDRRGAAHHREHREGPRRRADEQDRCPQPRRGGDVGVRDQAGQGVEPRCPVPHLE